MLYLVIRDRKCYSENMKILFIEWESYGNRDVQEAFRAEGHTVVSFPFTIHAKHRYNPEVEDRLSSVLRREVPDVVFSFNFFPVISRVCQSEGVRYISWVYDSPAIMLYSCTIINPCNTVYVFDKEVYLEFHQGGIDTVHYMPLAVDTDRLEPVLAGMTGKAFDYDVSFVGSMYMEELNYFPQMMSRLPEYARGYIDALIASQMKIWGYNFIQEMLGPVIDDLYKAYPVDPEPDGNRETPYSGGGDHNLHGRACGQGGP